MDLAWLVGISLPDPHYFIELGGQKEERILLASSLEFTRAQKEAQNCRIELLENYAAKGKSAIVEFLKTHNITHIEMHPETPFSVVAMLTKADFEVSLGTLPWYKNRSLRTPREIIWITEVQRAVESVLEEVRQRLMRAEIREVLVYEDGRVLTSEELQKFIENRLFTLGFISFDTIVSSGNDSAHPHAVGSGMLYAASPIIFDIFPRSRTNGRYADMTRTFFKGRPSDEILKMYTVVKDAQEAGIAMLKPGVDAREIHTAIENYFLEKGYETDAKTGSGFIHSTGHSINLRVHEPPGVGRLSTILQAGHLVTIEPGLYYPQLGYGIRIEDLILVTDTGFKNLTNFPKDLNTVIIS